MWQYTNLNVIVKRIESRCNHRLNDLCPFSDYRRGLLWIVPCQLYICPIAETVSEACTYKYVCIFYVCIRGSEEKGGLVLWGKGGGLGEEEKDRGKEGKHGLAGILGFAQLSLSFVTETECF